MNIRPISDLRNHYGDVEKDVQQGGPVFLTKNGYGSMVVMSMQQFERLNGNVEDALDAADAQAETTSLRYSHDEVFGSLREGMRRGRRPCIISYATSPSFGMTCRKLFLISPMCLTILKLLNGSSIRWKIRFSNTESIPKRQRSIALQGRALGNTIGLRLATIWSSMCSTTT